MRRSIVSRSLVLATAAIAVICILAGVGSATAASPSPHIICPMQSSVQPNPCCPLPTAAHARRTGAQPVCCAMTMPCCANTPCCLNSTCCPPAASGTCCPPTASGTCCPSTPCPSGSLTITSSPNPSTAGQKVVISGALAGSSVAGAGVVLWRKLVGQSGFHQIAQTTADSAGHYSFTLSRGTVMADQAWYVTASGAQSSIVQQKVSAVIALASSARSTVAGQTIVLRGHVTPSHAGELVLVEMSSGGAWHVIARPRLGRGSTYSVSHRFATAGTVQFRVVLRGDTRNERSTSHTVKVLVGP